AMALAKLDEATRRHEDANARWEAGFFGAEGKPADLAALEAERFASSTRLMALRWQFRPLRRSVPQIAWQVAAPEAVEQAHGARLAGIAPAFAAPVQPVITQSRALDRAGIRETWLRMPSPGASTGDIAWARVFSPSAGPIR